MNDLIIHVPNKFNSKETDRIKKCPNCFHYVPISKNNKFIKHLCKTKLKNCDDVFDLLYVLPFKVKSIRHLYHSGEYIYTPYRYINDENSHIKVFLCQLEMFFMYEYLEVISILNKPYPINLRD